MATTHRERVLKSIEHKEPDKIPIDLGAHFSSGITGRAYYDLIRYLGFDEKIKIHDPVQWIASPSKDVLEWIGASCIDPFEGGLRTLPDEPLETAWKKWECPEQREEEGEYSISKNLNIEVDEDGNEYIVNEDGVRMGKRSPDSPYFDDYPVEYHPLKDVDDIDEVDEVPMPLLGMVDWTNELLERLERNAKWFYENTDYALVISFGGSMFEAPTHLRGYEKFLIDLKRNPDFVRGLEEMLVEKYKKDLEKVLDAIDGYIQIIAMYDDLGHQHGQLLSPKDYRKLIHPYMKEVYQYIKNNSDCYILRHSCGSIKPFISDYIEMGVDILNPVQISAKDMEPKELKEDFGEEITFWGGGADTQSVLSSAPPEKVKKHVKELCEIFAPGGGFIFNQVHNIQPGVPPENIEAMYKGVREAQVYDQR